LFIIITESIIHQIPEVPVSHPLQTVTSFAEYKDGLFMLQYAMNASDRALPEEDFGILLRPFLWFSLDPKFEDLFDVCTAAMPVLGAYIIHKTKNENVPKDDFSLVQVSRLADLLAGYLDSGAISLGETEEAANIISYPCYSLDAELGKIRNLLKVDSVIVKKEEELNAGATAGLKEILKLSPKERIVRLKDKSTDLNTCKNCVYNIIRSCGKSLLKPLAQNIHKLAPTDQDFFLHGLDAFPKSKDVLAFYDKFLADTKYESLKEPVAKYRERVKKGVKTTGWET
jgi:hypothetical protein